MGIRSYAQLLRAIYPAIHPYTELYTARNSYLWSNTVIHNQTELYRPSQGYKEVYRGIKGYTQLYTTTLYLDMCQ